MAFGSLWLVLEVSGLDGFAVTQATADGGLDDHDVARNVFPPLGGEVVLLAVLGQSLDKSVLGSEGGYVRCAEREV